MASPNKALKLTRPGGGRNGAAASQLNADVRRTAEGSEVEEALVARIRGAFPGMEPPPAEQLASHACATCAALVRQYAGVRWLDVPGTVLDQTAGEIALFSPEAFVHYLPAFLCRSVAHPWIVGVGPTPTLQYVVLSLCDPGLPEDEWWAERVARLTKDQKVVIAEFLAWARSLRRDGVSDPTVQDPAEAGLARYWAAQ